MSRLDSNGAEVRRELASSVISPFGPEPLTPLSFLDRSAIVYADRLAVIDGQLQLSYADLADRARRLATALAGRGLGRGAAVSTLLTNSHVALESHFGVPGCGAALNALNTRLSAAELASIIRHAGSELLLVGDEFAPVAAELLDQLGRAIEVVRVGGAGDQYEALIGCSGIERWNVLDEQQTLSLNYTSGTTGVPKGVMYGHRGGYLQALAMATHTRLDNATRFLWTLPMFHCNGWCFPWAVTAAGGVHVCLERVDPGRIWELIDGVGVTHFNAAPTVLTALVAHPDAHRLATTVRVATGGAPPSPTLLADVEGLGFEVTHLYGLTETYGPAVICDWRPEWDALPIEQRAQRKAKQGVANVAGRPVRVVDRSGSDVPADGTTEGEVVLRGNVVMLGYFRDPAATAAATIEGPGGGWFRTGDIGVLHPDGYLELRDRLKDVIISGGENIASIEVEQALASHPAVSECAVVGVPDDYWGEVPVAHVTLRDGHSVSEQELIDHVKARLARYKAPKRVMFGDLPKTATGKIQKFALRQT